MPTPAPSKKVLLLGFLANTASGSPISQETLDTILSTEQTRCRANNYEMDILLLDPPNPDIATLKSKIRQDAWDVVAIGYGVRASQGWTGVFEVMVNLVVEESNGGGGAGGGGDDGGGGGQAVKGRRVPKFAFNLMPNQVLEAVKRVMEDGEVVREVEVGEGQVRVGT